MKLEPATEPSPAPEVVTEAATSAEVQTEVATEAVPASTAASATGKNLIRSTIYPKNITVLFLLVIYFLLISIQKVVARRSKLSPKGLADDIIGRWEHLKDQKG